MAWVVGIGIALLLLFAFPKQVISLIVIGILAIGLTLYFVDKNDRERREARQRDLAQVTIVAHGDPDVCKDPKYPLVVDITNHSPSRTLNAVTFSISAYRAGFSRPVVNAYSLVSDRILPPGKAHALCWSAPAGNLPEGETYQGLQWRADVSALEWQ